jgi:hypothetical protein
VKPKSIPLALLLLSPSALAYDHGPREGVILNRTDRAMYCYGDRRGRVCESRIAPGERCLGDAIGMGEGQPVYKVPNRSRFVCDERGCRPENWVDEMIFRGARVKNGRKYGWMEWGRFVELMGRRALRRCASVSEGCGG